MARIFDLSPRSEGHTMSGLDSEVQEAVEDLVDPTERIEEVTHLGSMAAARARQNEINPNGLTEPDIQPKTFELDGQTLIRLPV